jgi:hypothetical protein
MERERNTKRRPVSLRFSPPRQAVCFAGPQSGTLRLLPPAGFGVAAAASGRPSMIGAGLIVLLALLEILRLIFQAMQTSAMTDLRRHRASPALPDV